MALFKSLFGSKKNNLPRGFYEISIKEVLPLAKESVQVTFDIPSELTGTFSYLPGQYITTIVNVNGEECRRSYSICSSQNEALSIGVKKIENGRVSGWFNDVAKPGDTLLISAPEGNFIVKEKAQNIVAFAAGSGITPIASIAKELENSSTKLRLIFGNRTEDAIMFHDQLKELKNTSTTFYLSGEEKPGYAAGRLDKEIVVSIIKADLDILKSDYFMICGPEEMIVAVNDTLQMFGIPDEKIKYELFTTPVLFEGKKDKGTTFKGNSHVTVLLDDEKISFDLKANGSSILETVINEGLDAPYSCKGGVCSNCKAKVLKGSASMDMNFSLTDSEIEEGYILTCQAHPSDENVVISYNE